MWKRVLVIILCIVIGSMLIDARPGTAADIGQNTVQQLDIFIEKENVKESRKESPAVALLETLMPLGHTSNNFAPQISTLFETNLDLDFGDIKCAEKSAVKFMSKHLKVAEEEIKISSYHTSVHNGATHFYFDQVIKGLRIINAAANLTVKNGRVCAIGSSFYKSNNPSHEVQTEPDTSAEDAIRAFEKFLNITIPNAVEDSENIEFAAMPFTKSKIIPSLALLQDLEGGVARINPVWTFDAAAELSFYHACVSAKTNKVSLLHNYVDHATYNVIPFGVNDPDTGVRLKVVDPEYKIVSPHGWHKVVHKDGKEDVYEDTRGNNVWAQTNREGYWYHTKYKKRPTPKANHIFDFEHDPKSKEPLKFKDAAVTQLFYTTNTLHDLFYTYGFNEEAGNFQLKNYKLKGGANDALQAEAQFEAKRRYVRGTSGSMMTPGDGSPPIMTIGFEKSLRDNEMRDECFDNGIVTHEYLHGISNRLTGGRRRTGCLDDGQSKGLGEGWGDLFATIFQMNANSKRNDIFYFGKYTMGVRIRKYPYTVNQKVNPSNYADLSSNPEYKYIHRMGEVWASILLDVYWDLVDAFGFNPDWYNKPTEQKPATEPKGNIIFIQLVVDGMKIQPCNPTFIKARDAIIQADTLNNKGKYTNLLWKAFAKRGLGQVKKKSK